MNTPGYDVDEASEALMKIGELIIGDEENQHIDWDSMTVVSQVSEGHTSAFGYAYHASGEWTARMPESFETLMQMRALHDIMSGDGGPWWVSAMIQFKREPNDVSMHVDFEYDDPDRWKINPGNYTERIEELRPQ